jgi:hypothetical protein
MESSGRIPCSKNSETRAAYARSAGRECRHDDSVFKTIDEVRDAVRTFAARYNADRLIEKNGYLGPIDARAIRLD